MTKSLATIDYSPLVLAELQVSIAELVPEIRGFLETRNSASRTTALKQLQRIGNTLELLDLRGARLLVEETAELLCAPVFDTQFESSSRVDEDEPPDESDSASETAAKFSSQHGGVSEAEYMLFVATEKINEYLEYLKTGGRDTVPALVTLVNDLRASRGARLLSENIVSTEAFNIPLDADAGILGSEGVQRFKSAVKECRLPMMQALLAFCSSRALTPAQINKDVAPLIDIASLLERLEEASPNAALQDLWCAAKGLCQSVSEGTLESGPAVRQLLVQIERYSGELLEHMEERWEAEVSTTPPAAAHDSTLFSSFDSAGIDSALPFADRLFRNLLYYVALSRSDDPGIKAILARYELQALLEDLPSSSGRLESLQHGNKVDTSVVRSLGAEINNVQYRIAQHAEHGLLTAEQLGDDSRRLAQLGPTFMLLGESDCEKIVEQAAAILADIAVNPDPLQMQRLAAQLLTLGEHLEDMLHGGVGYELVANSFEHDMLGERQMSAYRLDQIVARCMSEARVRLSEAESVYLGIVELSEAGFATQSAFDLTNGTDVLDTSLDSSRDLSESLTETTGMDVSVGSEVSSVDLQQHSQRDSDQRAKQENEEVDLATAAHHHSALIEAAVGVGGARDALMIIPLPEVSPLLETIAGYLRRCAEHSHLLQKIPPVAHAAFADLLVSTSHYLDDSIQRQSAASDLLLRAEVAMQRIRPVLDCEFEHMHAALADDSVDGVNTDPDLRGDGIDKVIDSDQTLEPTSSGFVHSPVDTNALTGDKQGVIGERDRPSLSPDSEQNLTDAEVGTSMANTFTEGAIQRIGVIGRLLRQWHLQRSADLLHQMKEHYEELERTSTVASAKDLQNFCRVNKNMLGVLLERSDSVLESEDMLMQESVAVLPQLLNQLQFTTSDELSAAKDGGESVAREPVDGLSDLLARLSDVKPAENLERWNIEADNGLPADLDATQELDLTAIDTVAATIHEEVTEATLAEGATWADAEPPKARTLGAGRAPRINMQQIRLSQPPAISGAVRSAQDPETDGAENSKSVFPVSTSASSPGLSEVDGLIDRDERNDRNEGDDTEQLAHTAAEETEQSAVETSSTVDSSIATAASDKFESTVALESGDDTLHLPLPATSSLPKSAGTSNTSANQSDKTLDVGHDATADSTLFRVFSGECSGHIATLRGVAQTAVDAGAPVKLQERFARTLHTLHGSALTAEENEVADLADALEKYTNYFKQRSLALEKKHWAIVASSVDALSSVLGAREAGASAVQHSEPELSRLASALNELNRDLSNASQVKASARSDSGGIAGSGGPREQLFPIFVEEADAILRKLQGMYEQLDVSGGQHHEAGIAEIQDPQQLVLADALRQLHTLKGSARVAGCDQLAALAHKIEHCWLEWRNSERGMDADRHVLFQSSVDALVINLEQARTGQEQGDFDLLLSELEQDLSSQRSTGIENKLVARGVDGSVHLPKTNPGTYSGSDNQFSDQHSHDQTLELAESAPPVVTSETVADGSDENASTREFAVPELDETVALSDLRDVGTTDDPQSQSTVAVESVDGALSSVPVNTTLLGRLASLSTQISVQHASMNQGVTRLRESLLDLDKVAASLRQRLRDLDLETSLLPVDSQVGDSGLSEDAHRLSSEVPFADAVKEKQARAEQNSLVNEESSRQLSEVMHDLDTIRDSLHERLRYGEEALARSSRLTSDIHESVLMAKLIRFDELSHRLETVVRQSARSLNKSVRLELQGGGVAIEQEIHRQLAAPLEHLLRNAIAHGIEQPGLRSVAGKPEQGLIQLHVRIDGNQLKVDVADDGGGVNFQALREMTGGDAIGDEEILDMLLTRDLSTQSRANLDAGRGVGLGSVNQMLKDLNGSLRFRGSDTSGTCICMTIPLQLQINHAVVFECNGSRFGIAANYVRAIENQGLSQSRRENEAILQPGVEPELPTYWLDIDSLIGAVNAKPQRPATARRLLDDDAESEQVIRLEAAGRDVYLQPDRLIGFRDLVTRPLGAQLSSLGLYSGVSMESDGSKVLLLDVAGLVSSESLLVSVAAPATSPTLEKVPSGVAPAQVDTASMTTNELRNFVDDVDFGNTSDAISRGVQTTERPSREVMIVDDSVTLRTYTSGVLESAGLLPLEARDGLEALEALKRMSQPPCLLVVDVEMPRMDGFQLVSAVRELSHCGNLPVVMISSRTGASYRHRAAALGVVAYLGKPYYPEELQSVVENLQLPASNQPLPA